MQQSKGIKRKVFKNVQGWLESSRSTPLLIDAIKGVEKLLENKSNRISVSLNYRVRKQPISDICIDEPAMEKISTTERAAKRHLTLAGIIFEVKRQETDEYDKLITFRESD